MRSKRSKRSGSYFYSIFKEIDGTLMERSRNAATKSAERLGSYGQPTAYDTTAERIASLTVLGRLLSELIEVVNTTFKHRRAVHGVMADTMVKPDAANTQGVGHQKSNLIALSDRPPSKKKSAQVFLLKHFFCGHSARARPGF